MQCLYCGKGIGPIRQLRDLEFCSEAHRAQFRERYRQQVYEALAPEPAPKQFADFMERTPAANGPAPTAQLRVLPKPAPGACRPTIGVAAAGVSVERPGSVFAQRVAAIPARLAWHDSAAAFPVQYRSAFSIRIQPLLRSAAGAVPTRLAAGPPDQRPPVAAPRAPEPVRSRPDPVSLPKAAQIPTLAAAEPSSPRLRAATPGGADPAAIGNVPPTPHAAVALPCNAAIARPAAPAALQSAPDVHIAPAPIASQPRPLEAGPLPVPCDFKTALGHGVPVAFETSGARKNGIALPKPPMMEPAGHAEHPLGVTSRQRLAMASETRPGLTAGTPPTLAPASPRTVPAPIGALAELATPIESSPVAEAVGNLNLRSAVAAPPMPQTPAAQDLSAMTGALAAGLDSAPLHPVQAPTPAAMPAALPTWDAARAVAPDHPLVPLANIELPRIDCLPAPAGAVGEPVLPSRPDATRALRSSAVLWTLRVAHMFNPVFRTEPIKAGFNDLLRSGGNMPYSRDLEDRLPAKNNLRPFKREVAALPSKLKWQYVGAAAAALLLAGVLRPMMPPKTLGESLPWHGMTVRQWVSQRATRTFADNFRTGLSQWKGVQPRWPRSWSYSTDGFIHPGQLALYRPSVPLSDYRFEFMAQIETKSVDWVVRAKDADNYYALKFTVVQPGPRPIVAMVHYSVIDGRQGSRVQTPLRMMIHANTPYRVTVDVKGNRYRAFIEDQEADFWTDDKLKTGGVGFFSEAGEHARVYWVKLESHGDILGRICGLLSGNTSGGPTNKETQAMDYRHAGTRAATKEINGASAANSAAAATNTANETRISRVLSKAASLHLDGKLDEGAKELVRALDGGERHPALYFALGQLQYELQQYSPAAQSYAQAAVLQPLHPTAHFNAGVCLGRVEHWEEASAAFRKAISNDPARTEAHLALGACLVQLGLHSEALDAYDRFLERHPDHEEALFGKAVALQKRDRTSEAVELYRRILNRAPNSEEALGNLVSLALSNQDYDQVRKYAQRLADLQPKSQIALEGLAGAAFAAGDHKAAADYSRKLAELAPQVFENWFNLGVACHKAGDLANASKAYARATRVQPDSPQAHLNLGVAMQEQGDLKAARAAYQRALEIDPKLAGVHWNLGLVHEQLGELPAAEKLYAQVPENSPDSDDAAFRIGHLRLERSDYEGSIEAFESCLDKRPNWPEARLNLGIAHWRAGDKEAARTCFQELTASGADSKEALRGLAALSLEHQDYDKAFEIYRQLLDSGERTPELLYNAGLICQKRGDAEDAAVLYKEAIKADPQFGEALLNLGHALMSLGNEFEARSCWRKAVIAKPELAQRYFEPAAQTS
ncbi:MAG: tetratricopeptide repeat protein [Bryobacteraceae bacterium]